MNKKKLSFALLACVFALAGCQKNDGVPKVADYAHPMDADGKPITPQKFYAKYCTGKDGNETCAKMIKHLQIDSIRGGVPPGY